MELWRSKGLELLPDLGEQIGGAEEPMEAWLEISSAFQQAYLEPRNEDLIRRIYEFAFWCLEHGERDQAAGKDLPTCVVVGFFEDIPTHKAPREDMPRWFAREEVLVMRETFTYHCPGEFQSLLALWDEHEPSRRAKPSEAKRYRQYWRDIERSA
jgi:hypothetical protein